MTHMLEVCDFMSVSTMDQNWVYENCGPKYVTRTLKRKGTDRVLT